MPIGPFDQLETAVCVFDRHDRFGNCRNFDRFVELDIKFIEQRGIERLPRAGRVE